MSKLFTHILAPCLLLTAICLLPAGVAAQSNTAQLSGVVVDQNGDAVPGVKVSIMNPATGMVRTVTSDASGAYTIPLLPPATYTVMAEANGFKRVQLQNVVLNVGDQKSLKVDLTIGDVAGVVEVTSDPPLVDTDGAVKTVVDRQFVQNIPLNGRSFQSLITLTPGVVLVPAPGAANFGGQFSVNGQRASANSFMVDGVSANNAAAPANFTVGSAAGGNLPGLTALGTTQSLASVEELQEFSVQTSSYSAEYGRQPGGQISISTRSGQNQFHGSLFDYVRNEKFDANDWFANANRQPKTPLRQNDFGGTFSGPLPFLNFGDGGGKLFHSGKDRTFFFFSYEGLRLLLPAFTLTNVPSVCLRGLGGASCAPSPPAFALLQPYLQTFPLPNGRDLVIPQGQTNAGQPNGLSEFAASYSNPSNVDSTGIRIDHSISDKFKIFGRFNTTPSNANIRNTNNLSQITSRVANSETLTVGLTSLFSSRVSNDLRVNYSGSDSRQDSLHDDFGGALPFPNRGGLVPPERDAADLGVQMFLSNFAGCTACSTPVNDQFKPVSRQRQINIVDTFSLQLGSHHLKAGVDYRRLTPVLAPGSLLSWRFTSAAQLRSGTAAAGSSWLRQFRAEPLYTNFSAFGQDTWSAATRLTVTVGLRWEVNPAPGEAGGRTGLAVTEIDNLAAMRLAPAGTRAWRTTFDNLAPRLGISYQLGVEEGHEMVLRGGFGAYYDTGNDFGSGVFGGFPFVANSQLTGTALQFPLNPALVVPPTPPIDGTLPTQLPSITVFDPGLKLPYTLQWNVSAERSLGKQQTLTVSYVGSAGRRLIQRTIVNNIAAVNPGFTRLELTRNNATSDYHSLQSTFQRRLSKGLQALVSHTWSHAIDEDSQADGTNVPQRGNAVFDVRHVFAAAATYDVRFPSVGKVGNALLRDWSVDTRLQIQSAPPLDITLGGGSAIDPVTGENIRRRPNLVPGVPLYIKDDNLPCGRAINAQAFSTPLANQTGNLGRNALRGCGLWQVDLSLRREFRLREDVRLQLRADAFNVFNHPNFGTVTTLLGAGNFGKATSMLGRQLGGLNALHQIGGPRSMQFAARISF